MMQSTNRNESFKAVTATVSARSRSALRVHLRFLRLFLRWVFRREGIKWPYKRGKVRVKVYVRIWWIFFVFFTAPIIGLHTASLMLLHMGEEYAMSVCATLGHFFSACSLTLLLLYAWQPFVLQFGRRFTFLALVWSVIFVCCVGEGALIGLAEWHRMQRLALEAAAMKKIMQQQLYRLPVYNLYQPGQPTTCSPTANTPNSTECTCERTGSSIQ